MRLSPAHSVHRSGFTLIEILVVVAIIALLIAILLPSLKNAKEMARGAVCGTQMVQIFDASLMYSHTNKDRLPYFGGYWSYDQMGGTAVRQWWPTQIARFLGNNLAVYKCPSDKYPCPLPVRWINGNVFLSRDNTAAAVQLDITYRSSCDSLEDLGNYQYVPRKITSWRYPGKYILLVEADVQDPNLTNPHECFRLSDNLKYLNDLNPAYASYWNKPSFQQWKRHVGKSNFLFLDGHVVRLTPRQAAKLGTHQEYYLDPNTQQGS